MGELHLSIHYKSTAETCGLEIALLKVHDTVLSSGDIASNAQELLEVVLKANGAACQVDDECFSNKCAAGQCWPGEVGDPCDDSEDVRCSRNYVLLFYLLRQWLVLFLY